MNAKQRLQFVIEHLNTPFKPEILRDLEEALNDARVDELESSGIVDGLLVHYNEDGSTVATKDIRIMRLKGIVR